jgi:hypothetical protein
VVSIAAYPEDAMARARKQIVSTDDTQFKKIEAALGCELPIESRQWILFAIKAAPIIQRMQADLQETIFQVAKDIVVHATGLEQALKDAAKSADISHWLSDFAYGDLNELGVVPQAIVQSVAAHVSALKESAKIVLTMQRRGRGRPKQKDRELVTMGLKKALIAIPFPKRPTVARFARVIYPYLNVPPKSIKSIDALADLLNAALGESGRKNPRES